MKWQSAIEGPQLSMTIWRTQAKPWRLAALISFLNYFQVRYALLRKTKKTAARRAKQPAGVYAGVYSAAGLALCIGLFSQGATAQLVEKRISALNPLDRQYMDTQRDTLNELTLRYYGGRCCRSQSELDYLQRLLNDGHVQASQTKELQAMGIALGDLLAAQLDMEWVVYEDIQGRSRALRLGETENYLFPVTMIARRYSAGDKTPVIDIYKSALEAIESVRPPLPFQQQ